MVLFILELVEKIFNKMKLKDLFWDYSFNEAELRSLLEGKVNKVSHLDKAGLYARILTSMRWYEIVDLVGKERLEELLDDEVLTKIYSKDLRRKFTIAKRILHQ